MFCRGWAAFSTGVLFMPFDKVETQVDLPAQEREVLAFWDRIDAFEKLRAQNRGKPKWSFLDGPITANNPMGVHHAWGRTYKDAYQPLFRHDRPRAALPERLRLPGALGGSRGREGAEAPVEARHRKPGAGRSVRQHRPSSCSECKDRVDKFARIQTEQSIRLGYWMDWDRTDADWARPPDDRKSYFTMSEENNYTIWGFLKKCHERGWFIAATTPCPGARAAPSACRKWKCTRVISSSPTGRCS